MLTEDGNMLMTDMNKKPAVLVFAGPNGVGKITIAHHSPYQEPM